jgi:L-asparaginase
MDDMTIRIIATGGTFDKQYRPVDGSLGFIKSLIPSFLEQGRVRSPVVFEELFLLDSLDMTEDDRQRVLDACIAAPEDKILIVHGTDTMRETAVVLAVASLEKTIVFTGAMIPAPVVNSDAFFNLGYAFAKVQALPPDVYIAMNGMVFKWDNVRKNHAEGIFEAEG